MLCWITANICSTQGCSPFLLQDFEVFFAQDEVTLYDKVTAGDTAWCGLERLISGHRDKCSLSISPFQTTFIGIVPSQGHKLSLHGILLHSMLPVTPYKQLQLAASVLQTCHYVGLTWLCSLAVRVLKSMLVSTSNPTAIALRRVNELALQNMRPF